MQLVYSRGTLGSKTTHLSENISYCKQFASPFGTRTSAGQKTHRSFPSPTGPPSHFLFLPPVRCTDCLYTIPPEKVMLLQSNSVISHSCRTVAKIVSSTNCSEGWQVKTRSSMKLSRLSYEKDRQDCKSWQKNLCAGTVVHNKTQNSEIKHWMY